MIADIDWAAPWLAPWRQRGEPITQQVLAGVAQPEALNAAAQQLWPAPGRPPVHFVPQTDLPAGKAYEQYIFESGQCPTREGLHDFFNGLMWLHLPRTKTRLNQLQAAQIERLGIAPVRGPARDALTLFDENVALLRAPDALWNALVAKDWSQVFGRLRPLWHESSLWLFGHALMEKLVVPRKPATAHVYRVCPATDDIASLDTWLATDLSADRLAEKPFAHLPVLGVPGWWPGNEVPGFYEDASVFRAPRCAAHK
ncbi:DUF3025 domain-containing protein [Rhodoferax sp. BLA1]|uniref:DUF3025 domain-containing protein n=1 Tax=Rhodoferax sp. BLA1 TaxID=2576062 RepID=UPI001C551087|nr:DUF3025 domain-containing protein [Rhodoferax sp. BLA1]